MSSMIRSFFTWFIFSVSTSVWAWSLKRLADVATDPSNFTLRRRAETS